jgi:glycosyltransferase involved in cell wall biosynthesis
MDYMRAGRPIIQALGAGNDIVAESGCGISVPAQDSKAIAGAVIELMGLRPEQREKLGSSGSRYVRLHHDIRILAARFLSAVFA